MELNIRQLAITLSNAKSQQKHQRTWSTVYNEKTSDYWNNLIWSTILENRNINGTTVDKYELIDMFSNYLKREDIIDLFSRITAKHRTISRDNLTEFLQNIDELSYIALINLFKPIEYKNLILNAIHSPNDNRDWIYDNFTNIDIKQLPLTLDYRDQLQPVRNQGQQGTCYAQSAACMKEWQESKDYGLNEYLSPQFLYNIRHNLYDDISNNDEGMYGRNVMQLLKNIGICLEKSYRYERIEHRNKMATHYFTEAHQHKIKYYARISSQEALKWSLLKNGPCLIVFPVYNYTPQLWYRHKNTETLLGGHAMTIVGYTRDSFIIRNSWGDTWGDSGYTYYYYKNWGLHWEIWTTIDEKSKPNQEPSPEPLPEPCPEPITPITPPPSPNTKSSYLSIAYRYIVLAKDWLLDYLLCIKQKII